MKVYISGPIAGHPEGNRPAFAMFAEAIRSAGWEPVNPHDVPPDHEGRCRGPAVPTRPGEPAKEHQYGCYMKPDLIALMDCDAIVMMPGWMQSRGAGVERDVALICGLVFVDMSALGIVYP